MSNEAMENIDVEELLQLAKDKKYRQLKEALLELNEVDIALFFEELELDRVAIVFRMLPKELATEVFAELQPDLQEHVINSITDRELSEIVEDLFVDDAVDMLEEMPATIVRRVMENTKPETRKLINQFLNYPENSAGSIMTAEYIGLKKHMTVEECFAFIRKHGIDSETIYTCYVMGVKRQLEGVVTVKDLLMNPYEALVGDIMDDNVIKVPTTMDQEEVVDTMNKYDLLSLPVVDSEDRLVGIITVDDVMDVMEEEATEDIEKMAAMLPSEKPYLKTGVFELAKNRIPWLLFLMLSSTLSGAILTRYENAFAAIPLLVSFTPMLMNTGGNSGSQSSEGSPCRSDRGNDSGGCQFHPPSDPVPGKYNDQFSRCAQRICDSCDREDHRLHTSDRCQSPENGPGDHGRTTDHNNRGCRESDRIFQSCLHVAGYDSIMGFMYDQKYWSFKCIYGGARQNPLSYNYFLVSESAGRVLP